MKTVLEHARAYVAMGYSVVPVAVDGTKKPLVAWKAYQTRQPTDAELTQWFGKEGAAGIALVHGQVSGYSEVIDIETEEAYQELRALCEDHGRLGLLLTALHVVTPTGGRHLYYRCPDGVDGNLQLAKFGDKSVKIETRGEGGYSIAPGSPSAVHQTGNLYLQIDATRGVSVDEFQPPTIAAADRQFLHAMASACNEFVEPERTHKPKQAGGAKSPGARLGDDFNARGDVLPTLLAHGWHEAGRRMGPEGEVVDLTRAGKSVKAGISATLGYVGPNVLYVFSSNADPFDSGRAYPPFSVYGLLQHGGDFGAAAKDLAVRGYGDPFPETVELKFTAPGKARTVAVDGEDELPMPGSLPQIVVTNEHDREIAAKAWQALIGANEPPLFFARGLGMLRLRRDADTRRVVTEYVEVQRLMHRLRRVADFYSVRNDRQGKAVTGKVPVPTRIAEDMISDGVEIGKLPSLRNIVYAPFVSRDGSIAAKTGYYSEDKVYLDLAVPVRIPDTPPTQADARCALAKLFSPYDGVFGQFPYASATDLAHAIALLLTPLLRPYIGANAPLALVEAPERGTGKSTLARNLIAFSDPYVKTVDTPTSRRPDDAEAEWSKILGASLKDGSATLFLDNIRGVLASQSLETLLTSPEPVSIRLLGTGENVTVWPQNLTLVGTSNNVETSRDMARRCYTVRLNANMERPEDRTGFRIPDLDMYVKRHRAELLESVVIIIAAWVAAGRPEGRVVKGSYDRWARVMSGILEFLEMPGFLQGEEERALYLDPETARWKAFFEFWNEEFGQKEMQGKNLLECAVKAEVIADASVPGAARSLGKHLTRFRDRVFGGLRLVTRTDRNGVLCYSLRPTTDATSAGFAAFAGFSTHHTREGNTKDDAANSREYDGKQTPQSLQTPQTDNKNPNDSEEIEVDF